MRISSARGKQAIALALVVLVMAFVSGWLGGGAEGFMLGAIDPDPARYSGKCIGVPAPTSPLANDAEKQSTCASICGINDNYYTVAKGYRVSGTKNNMVLCNCCDPGTTASLVSQSATTTATGGCKRGVNFGVNESSRALTVKDGCDGVFAWGDGSKFACNSNVMNETTKAIVQSEVTCPFFKSDIDTNMQRERTRNADMVNKALSDAKRIKEEARQQRLKQDIANTLIRTTSASAK